MSDPEIAKYECMPKSRLEAGSFYVEAVQPSHIELIRQWRNAQIEFLRQSNLISPEQQRAYYQTNVWPDMRVSEPKNILLSYYEKQDLIGYGGLVHIAWEHRRAEVSFLLRTELSATEDDFLRYFPAFLRLMKSLAFEDLGLNRLCTETYAIRERYISVLESTGFRREGVLKQHVRIKGVPMDSFLHGCLSSYAR
ncbi:MAG TPA: GNAT family protein [Burkholderiales bacterium]|nr:GNAT family protein [Burkholderiales bacterium]